MKERGRGEGGRDGREGDGRREEGRGEGLRAEGERGRKEGSRKGGRGKEGGRERKEREREEGNREYFEDSNSSEFVCMGKKDPLYTKAAYALTTPHPSDPTPCPHPTTHGMFILFCTLAGDMKNE